MPRPIIGIGLAVLTAGITVGTFAGSGVFARDTDTKTVFYHGGNFSVPQEWPVFRDGGGRHQVPLRHLTRSGRGVRTWRPGRGPVGIAARGG
jgi:hypothetical protein